MIKLYIILLIIFFTNCKDKQVNKGKLINDDLTYSEEIIRNDTLDLSTSSKPIELAEKIFNSKMYSVNDTIYFNDQILNPFYGSNKDKSSFDSYSGIIKENNYVSSVRLAKDKKIIKISLKLCIEADVLLDKNLISKLTYLTEEKYLIDGGETRILKFYCSRDNIIIFGFNKPNHTASIHPKCNYTNKEIPVFMDMVAVYDIKNFNQHTSSLSYDTHNKKEIIEKVELFCK